MTLCEGAIRYAGPLLLVWRRVDPTRCRNEVRSCTPGNSGGSDRVGIVFQTGSAGSKPSVPFGGLDAETLPARSPLRMISVRQDWLVSSGLGDAREKSGFGALRELSHAQKEFCSVRWRQTQNQSDLEEISGAEIFVNNNTSRWQLR